MAKYKGRSVKLNKPMRGDVKKFKVFVRNKKTGRVQKVNFGKGKKKWKTGHFESSLLGYPILEKRI